MPGKLLDLAKKNRNDLNIFTVILARKVKI